MAEITFNPMETPEQPADRPAPVAFDPTGIEKLRAMKAKAPNAGGMTDAQFALAMHQNHYSDMPLTDYLNKVGLDRGDILYELRTPGDPYGDYLRQTLAAPGAGETTDQAAVRQGGQIGERRAGDLEGPARAYVQGGMFGWGDEAVAAGAAALDPLVHGDRGKDFGERYDAYLGRERGLVDNFREDNPVAAYGAEIAGAIPTAIATGPTRVAATTLGRIGTSMAVNTGQGAVYGAGASDGDVIDRAKGAGFGAITGAATGAVIDGVTGLVNSAFRQGAKNKAVTEAIDAAPTADALKAKSQAAYDAAENAAVTLKPTATSILKHDLGQFLNKEGLMSNGKMVGDFGRVRKALKHLETIGSQPMTIKAFQRLEESFQNAARSSKPGEARIGKIMLDQLDQFMDSLPQGAFDGAGDGVEAAARWKAGKDQWALHKRTKLLEDAIYEARLSRNFTETLKSKLGGVLLNDKQRGRLSPEDIEQMERFVMGGGPIGRLMQYLSTSGGMGQTIFAGAAGGPVAAIGTALGPAVVRKGIDSGAARTANELRASVASGSRPQPQAFEGLDLRALAPGLGNVDERPRDFLESLVARGAR